MRFFARRGGWEEAGEVAVVLERDGVPLGPSPPRHWLGRGDGEPADDGKRRICFVPGAKGDRLHDLLERFGHEMARRGEPPASITIALPEVPSGTPGGAAHAIALGFAKAWARHRLRPGRVELLYSDPAWDEAVRQAVEATNDWVRTECAPPSSCAGRLFFWGIMCATLVVLVELNLPDRRLRVRASAETLVLGRGSGETLELPLDLEILDPDLELSGITLVWPPLARVDLDGLPATGSRLRVRVPVRLEGSWPEGGKVEAFVLSIPSDGSPIASFHLYLVEE